MLQTNQSLLTSAPTKLRRAIFLDRDGVINRAITRDGLPFPPMSLGDFEILPGVPEACVKLKSAGFLLVVATNQPDVGRGIVPRELVEAMNAKMQKVISLDRIEICFHPGQIGRASCRERVYSSV